MLCLETIAPETLALRSLSCLVDAEMEPLLRMLKSFDWEDAKSRISEAVREMVR